MKKYFLTFALFIISIIAFGQKEQTSGTLKMLGVENDTIKTNATKHNSISDTLVINSDSILVNAPISTNTPVDSSSILVDSPISTDAPVNSSMVFISTVPVELEDSAKNEVAQFGFVEAKETRRYMPNFKERRSKYEFTFKSPILRPGDVLTFHYTDIIDRKEKTKSGIYKEGLNTLLINNADPVSIRYQGTVWISIKRKGEIIFDRVKVANNWFSVEE